MKSFWIVFLILFCAAALCSGASADVKDQNEPVELLREKWESVTSVLKDKEMEREAKERQINKILAPLFDFPLMAKLSLGRKHWPRLSPDQRERFTELFIKRLKGTYRDKIESYTDEKLQFKEPVQKSKRIVYVPTELVPGEGEKKIYIVYKLRLVEIRREVKEKSDREKRICKMWKIYDVEIQGVSILLSYRAQFEDILSHGSVEELLSRLKEPRKQ